jgi:CheY-like chemotaxis protein
LVDDDPDDNFLHQIVIRESGLSPKVVVAENGEVAWQYLTDSLGAEFEKPDVIFLDINMPRMNGFEFLSHYKTLAEDLRTGTKVVILSTSSHPHDLEKARSIFPDIHYHTKPLTETLLRTIVNDGVTLSNVK